jgi:peptidoglycan hydrolase-like protein with peptidoglycan-binding domain
VGNGHLSGSSNAITPGDVPASGGGSSGFKPIGIPIPVDTPPPSELSQSGSTPRLFTQTLYINRQGTETKSLQKFLNTHGFVLAKSGAGSPGNETNIFSNRTKNAVIAFQKKYNIKPTIGFFGPITRAKVNKIIVTENKSPLL